MINNYHIKVDRQESGPFSHIELMEQGLSPDTLIKSPMSNDWEYAGTLPEFYRYFESAGVYYPGNDNMAGFWWRLLAYAIDYVILLSCLFAIGIFIGLLKRYAGFHIVLYEKGAANIGFKLTTVIVMILYHAIFESLGPNGSVGKIICKLKVVDPNGFKISFLNALGRNAGKILSSLLCGMGFLNIFWNIRKQAWHDQLAQTYVVKKRI